MRYLHPVISIPTTALRVPYYLLVPIEDLVHPTHLLVLA